MATRTLHMIGIRHFGHAYLVRYRAPHWRDAATTVQSWACEGQIDPGDAGDLVAKILSDAMEDGELVG